VATRSHARDINRRHVACKIAQCNRDFIIIYFTSRLYGGLLKNIPTMGPGAKWSCCLYPSEWPCWWQYFLGALVVCGFGGTRWHVIVHVTFGTCDLAALFVFVIITLWYTRGFPCCMDLGHLFWWALLSLGSVVNSHLNPLSISIRKR
jgi:hypothetical protein